MKAEDVTFTGKDYRYTYSGVTDDEIQEEYDQNYTTTLYIDRAKEIIDTYSGTSVSIARPKWREEGQRSIGSPGKYEGARQI